MKPIDWTQPLREVGSKQPVIVMQIDPAKDWPITLMRHRTGAFLEVNRNGCGKEHDDPIIENTPVPPRLVDRWMAVDNPADGVFINVGASLHASRGSAEQDATNNNLLIAKLTIEVPQ